MLDLRSSSWTEGFNATDGREQRIALVREKWNQECPGTAGDDATEFQFGDPQKTRLLSKAAFENLWDGGEPSGDIKVIAAHGGPAFESTWPCIGNPQLGTLATVQRKTKEFIMPAGYPDAEWQVVLSCFALGDLDGQVFARKPPDEANEFKLLKNGLHIVLGFETRVHSDLDKDNFKPCVGDTEYQPLSMKFARFMADMKTGTPIQEAWLEQMASPWYWRTEKADMRWQNPGEKGPDGNGGNKMWNGIDDDNNGYIDDWLQAYAWREIPRVIACNLGSPSAMTEKLPIGNAPREIAADIMPGQKTHVYAADNKLGEDARPPSEPAW
jgi:hypothetical protein